MYKPNCPVHVSARMKLREFSDKAPSGGPYNEPNVKERRLYWRCEVAGCSRVREYQRLTAPKRPRCIHCRGPVDTANRHLIAVCKGCRNKQRQARFQAKKRKQRVKLVGRADGYKRTKQPGIRI